MNINIYQIDLEKDTDGVSFEPYFRLEQIQGSKEINSEIYNHVYSGDIESDDLEMVYYTFNSNCPEEYIGRSLSVSDIVEVRDSSEISDGFYYCDSISFQKVDFDPSLCSEYSNKRIEVVVCEPGKNAYVDKIGTSLKELQNAVDGCIEAYYPFETEECIVCNDEGKFNGSSPCRAIYGEDGEIIDIVFGKFIICDCSGENFGSLNSEQKEHYLEKYKMPEHFLRIDGEIQAIKYEPREAVSVER